jgi:hypothetical protein
MPKPTCHACKLPFSDAYAEHEGKFYHPGCYSDKAKEVEEEIKSTFKTACGVCGSTNLMPTGTCSICVACGESVGGC